jgi:hypothetical protein
MKMKQKKTSAHYNHWQLQMKKVLSQELWLLCWIEEYFAGQLLLHQMQLGQHPQNPQPWPGHQEQ